MNREHGVIVLTWTFVFAGAYLGARLPGWDEAREIRAETARKWGATLKSAHEATENWKHLREEIEDTKPCLEPKAAPDRKATQIELAREHTRRAMIAFTPMARNSPLECLENDALVMADLDREWERIMRDMRQLAAEGD